MNDPIVEALKFKAECFHFLSNLVLVFAVPIALYLYVAFVRVRESRRK